MQTNEIGIMDGMGTVDRRARFHATQIDDSFRIPTSAVVSFVLHCFQMHLRVVLNDVEEYTHTFQNYIKWLIHKPFNARQQNVKSK